ncbi:hypothetical protein [Haloarchaeobius sp. DYHT-AS-18]|uniref:hypothetical protein n=1 Tax=Haloarchaeobius sp. DYHT-AS-18 TaxID=3446117 RepID=UPI003EBCCC90
MAEPNESDTSGAEALASLFVELGTRYETAHLAGEAIESLPERTDARHDAVSIWCSIVETESASRQTSDGMPEDPEEGDDRRTGAMRALATLAREHPASAPLDVFLARIDDTDPLVRLYASYGIVALSSQDPERVRPHIDRLVATADPDPNAIGAGVWGTPKRSTPAWHVDRLASAKLFRAAFQAVLAAESTDEERWAVMTTVGSRLAGNVYDVCDVLVEVLPGQLDIWPAYLGLLERYRHRQDPSTVDDSCAKAICYRLEWACEDRRDGDLDWSVAAETVAGDSPLGALAGALGTISDPDCVSILGRGIGDLLRAFAVDRYDGECQWFSAPRTLLQDRLLGRDPIDTSDIRGALEAIVDASLDAVPDDVTAPAPFYDRGVTNLLAEVAAVDPAVVRPKVDRIHTVLKATHVGESDEHDAVLENCCRTLTQLGAASPEVVAPAASTVQETVRAVVDASRFDLLDSVLGALVVTATQHPVLLDPFVPSFREWCRDPPGDDDPFDLHVSRSSIRYYAVWGLRFDTTAETHRVLERVAADTDAAARVRDAARAVLERGGC